VALVLDRAGIFHWRDQWTLWPLILGGIGLARFLQSLPGEPKQGLLFMTAAVWLFLVEGGWLSMEDSWPIVIIVLGVIVALNGGRRRRRWRVPGPPVPGEPHHIKHLRRPDRPLSGLATIGIWIAIVIALQVSGIRSFSANTGVRLSERVGIVSVMGRSEHVSRATVFQGADITNIMGRSELDLSDAMLAPGAAATVEVFSAMGNVTLRVPRTWTVETRAVSALGGIQDERGTPPEAEATDSAAPRLVLRGLVLFGRLTITS